MISWPKLFCEQSILLLKYFWDLDYPLERDRGDIMAQDDLSAGNFTLNLPALRYGPVRVRVGNIEAILRPASTVDVKREGEVIVSARLKEPLYRTDDGERLMVTARRNIARPKEIDGVLIRSESGKLSWLHHRLIEELESEAAEYGWPEVVHRRSEQWGRSFSFRSEQENADGSVDEDIRFINRSAFCCGSPVLCQSHSQSLSHGLYT